MLKNAFGTAMVIGALAVGSALAQAQAPAAPAAEPPAADQAPAPAPATPATDPVPAPASAPAPGGGGQKVGQTGNPDPGVNFLNVVENPHVRVLQVTLQPGAVRRPHVHNDVKFHMLVPITGSLELTIEKDPVITTVPGQAYYMMKGQTHTFTNKSSAAVQVIELFIKPEPATAEPDAAGTTAPPAEPAPATPETPQAQ